MSNTSQQDSRCPTARALLPLTAVDGSTAIMVVDGAGTVRETTVGTLLPDSPPNWTEGDSRALRRTVSAEDCALFADLSGLNEPVTLSEPFSRFVAVADIETFAAVSGDDQALHLSDEFARNTPFGKRIAHGMLTASYIAAALRPHLGDGFVYLSQTLEFVAPVFPRDKITVIRSLVRVDDSTGVPLTVLSTICQNQEGKTVLSGEAVIAQSMGGKSESGTAPVPHMLPVSHVSAVLGKEIPGQGAIYRKQSLTFVAPVYAGDTIATTATIVSYDRGRGRMVLSTVSTNQHGDLVLTGEAVIVCKPEMFVTSAPKN